MVSSLTTTFCYDVSRQLTYSLQVQLPACGGPRKSPTYGVEVGRAQAQLVHVLQAALHQTVAVRVAAAIAVGTPQDLLVFEQALALLFAQGTHRGRAVRRGC